jgi:hypothetical protein
VNLFKDDVVKIFLHKKDLFDVVEADTIALPIDGLVPGLEGSVAHQLLRRLGAGSLAEIYQTQPDYPFNGRAHWSSLESYSETHFDWLCALGTGIRSSSGIDGHGAAVRPTQKQLARAVLADMFQRAEGGELGRRIACPVLSGGGRIRAVDVAYIMLDEASRYDHGIELHIAERNQDVFDVLRPILG